jgi:hypothetical protein
MAKTIKVIVHTSTPENDHTIFHLPMQSAYDVARGKLEARTLFPITYLIRPIGYKVVLIAYLDHWHRS